MEFNTGLSRDDDSSTRNRPPDSEVIESIEESDRERRAHHSIWTPNAPPVAGPYSQGIATPTLIFLAGQIGFDPTSKQLVPGGIKAETARALENLGAVLKEGGSSFDRVIKTTVFLRDLKDFAEMNAVYETYFPGIKPARSCVQVARLPSDVAVEIECIALR